MINAENSFSPSDLFKYAESLLKECKARDDSVKQGSNNYGWLSSRQIHNEDIRTNKELEILRPMMQKLSSENCAKIAVKLEDLTDGVKSKDIVLSTFKQLLEEQYSIQLMDKNVIKSKERSMKKNKVNKVHPVLVPDGRQPTVSFILNC